MLTLTVDSAETARRSGRRVDDPKEAGTAGWRNGLTAAAVKGGCRVGPGGRGRTGPWPGGTRFQLAGSPRSAGTARLARPLAWPVGPGPEVAQPHDRPVENVLGRFLGGWGDRWAPGASLLAVVEWICPKRTGIRHTVTVGVRVAGDLGFRGLAQSWRRGSLQAGGRWLEPNRAHLGL